MVVVGDLAGEQGLVVVFTGIHCVYAKKYESRLLKLHAELEGTGMGMVLVNSNDPAMSHNEDLAHMKAHATERAYPFDFLSDPGHQFADSLGAKKNPEAFVFQATEEGLTPYFHGSIDDNPVLASNVKVRYLYDAVQALLAGEAVQEYEGTVKGCSIKRMR